jgi:hypothetical protein
LFCPSIPPVPSPLLREHVLFREGSSREKEYQSGQGEKECEGLEGSGSLSVLHGLSEEQRAEEIAPSPEEEVGSGDAAPDLLGDGLVDEGQGGQVENTQSRSGGAESEQGGGVAEEGEATDPCSGEKTAPIMKRGCRTDRRESRSRGWVRLMVA